VSAPETNHDAMRRILLSYAETFDPEHRLTRQQRLEQAYRNMRVDLWRIRTELARTSIQEVPLPD
jgi:hypothetical protein